MKKFGKKRNEEIIDLKLDLLLEGIQVHDSALEGLGEKYREEVHWLFEWDEHEHTNELSPSEIIFENNMIVQVYENSRSSYTLERDKNGKLLLKKDGKIVNDEIKYPERPKLLSQKTSDGIPFKKVIGFRGLDCLSVSFSLQCKFWNSKQECHFCNIMTTKGFEEQKSMKKAKWIAEAIQKGFENGEISHFIITGGTIDNEVQLLKNIFDKIKLTTKMEHFKDSNCTMTAPRLKEDIKTIAGFGVEYISYNLEIWNEDIFNEVCPGKSDWIGGQKIWISRLIETAEYQGWGKVRSNFVAGLEPLESLKEGAKFLASNGVLPAFIPFNKPFSPNIRKNFNFTKNDFWDLTRYFVELYDKYNMKPSYCYKCYCNSTYIDYYTLLYNP